MLSSAMRPPWSQTAFAFYAKMDSNEHCLLSGGGGGGGSGGGAISHS